MKKAIIHISIIILILKGESTLAQNKMQMVSSFDASQISEKTMEDANSAFRTIAESPVKNKTCKEKANNCENKTEFSFYVLNKLGFKPINFWIFKEGDIDGLKDVGGLNFDTKTECGILSWHYHVAAGIIINNNSAGYDTLIFDPFTKDKLISLKDWALRFFPNESNRKISVFPVLDNYSYFANNATGKLWWEKITLLTEKDKWQELLDNNYKQMYCGLCGITPNKKCNGKESEINLKKAEILKYLKEKGVN